MALLDSHARQLGRDLGLEAGLSHTEAGTYRLELSPDFVIEMSPLAEGFVLTTDVGSAEVPDREELFVKLLRANLFGQGTGRAALSLDSKAKRVRLTASHAGDITYAEYKEDLEQFLNFAEFWKGELGGRETDR